ncbi:barstar family protein [Luteolibacter soli]|uniref:Barstar family protein n=1 Tax=Luteolibacter soli TaxID=3135280 RepID=A0ABU9AVZ2_9BACT
MSDDEWPFDQGRDVVTMTSRGVMRGGEAITHAYHDESDHGWQFYSASGAVMAEAMIVAMEEIVKRDGSVREIADLPPGWMAVRTGPGAPWVRTLQYADAPVVRVDWSLLTGVGDFYDAVLVQCDAPSWHGRNLDALRDAWVTGGINGKGPPYAFEFLGMEVTREELLEFRDAVVGIAEESMEENGGRWVRGDPCGK